MATNRDKEMNLRANKLLMAVLASAALVSLAACGGGGGSDPIKTSAAAPTSVASSTTGALTFNHPTAASAPTTTASAPFTTPTTDTPASSVTTSTPTVSTGTTTPATPSTPASAASSTPASSTPATTASIFYGVNGHNNEGGAYDISSPALQLSQLQDLGAKVYRNEVYSQAGATKLAGIAKTMAAGGVTVYPVMLMGLDAGTDEASGYKAGYALGQQTATAYKYPYYEVTNELEADCLTGNVDGVNPTDFDNTKFQIARGIIRGMIDGVKSVDPNGKIIMGGGAWLHYGFYQMLANGTQPDGTSGHTVPQWDISAWHWYSDQGDIVNACGGTGCHNVLATLQQFGKPIWINEFGVRPSYGTDQQIATYLVGNKMMAEFAQVASKYNIQAIQFYELYDDPAGGEGPYGLLQNDGKTQKATYSAYKNFIATNPK